MQLQRQPKIIKLLKRKIGVGVESATFQFSCKVTTQCVALLKKNIRHINIDP